jgi:hypothetical protein
MDARPVSPEGDIICRNLRALRLAPRLTQQPTLVSDEGRSLLTLALALPDDVDLGAWLTTDRRATALVMKVNSAIRDANLRGADRARLAGWPAPESTAYEGGAGDGFRALRFAFSTVLPMSELDLGPPVRSLHPRSRVDIAAGQRLIVDEVVMRTGGFTVAATFLLKHQGSGADPSRAPMWRGFDLVEDNLGNPYVSHPIRGSAERRRTTWRLPLFTLFLPEASSEATELRFHVASTAVTWPNGPSRTYDTNPRDTRQSADAVWRVKL